MGPIKKIRAGQIVCSIWENPATKERNFPTNSVTLEKNCKVVENHGNHMNYYKLNEARLSEEKELQNNL